MFHNNSTSEKFETKTGFEIRRFVRVLGAHLHELQSARLLAALHDAQRVALRLGVLLGAAAACAATAAQVRAQRA